MRSVMKGGMGLVLVAVAVTGPAGGAAAHGPHPGGALDGGGGAPAARTVSAVLSQPLAAAAAGPAPTTVATILSISDFHGRLNPTTFRIDVRGQRFGGAAYLQSYFEQRAALSPTPPFVVTQGDAVGATQPVSSLLGDRPTIDVMNRMGFDADTLGNHNFDNGVEHMRDLAGRADFPYLVANLTDAAGGQLPWTQRSTTWEVDGVRIGVTGAMNEDAGALLKPGSLGDLRIGEAAPALNAAAAELRAQGVGTVVALAHVGAEPARAGANGAEGPLIELAKRLRGVDVLIGDHTYWQVNQPVTGADGRPVWVVQSVPQGITFSEIKLTIGKLDGRALGVAATQFPATTHGVTPDEEIAAVVEDHNAQVEPLVEEPVGSSTRSIPENVAVAEANQGNVVADALRSAAGTQLALYHSGGLRAPLTDEDRRDGAGDYVIRRGDVLAMLPFNDQITSVTVTGAELRRMLENGVSQVPTPAARFPQVSGFSFRYRPAAPAQSRVTRAALDDGTPIDFSDAATYTLVTNDFVALGGDGYPNFKGRVTYLGDVEDEVIAYLQAHPALVPPGPPHEDPRRIVAE